MSSVTVHENRIDYFTCTARMSESGPVYSTARQLAVDIERVIKPHPWRFFGYVGEMYSGRGLGHFAWGESNGSEQMGVIVQASGEFAGHYVGRFLLPVSRFSRVDLAVDAEVDTPRLNIAKEYYDWLGTIGYGRTYSIIQNNLGGQTFYLGSRQSDQFGRVYDKGVETGKMGPGLMWRYEVEYKGTYAKAAIQAILGRESATLDLGKAIATTVWDWWNERECLPIYTRSNCAALDISARFLSSDDDRRLAWLRQQVSPTVRDLITRGNREVLDALGLTDFYVFGLK